MSRTGQKNKKFQGFTLVELLVSVAVIAVGMVFVLGALNQCMTSILVAEKTITATSLLNKKMWEIDVEHFADNGSVLGARQGTFDAPYESFNWTQTVTPILAADFGNETSFVQENLHEETFQVAWKQGKTVRDIRVVRYVKRKKEE